MSQLTATFDTAKGVIKVDLLPEIIEKALTV